MFDKFGYNKKLEELVKAKKADESIAAIVKENLKKIDESKKNIKQLEKQIKVLNEQLEEKNEIKMNTSILNFKYYAQISLELRKLYKELKQKNSELNIYNEEIESFKLQNKEIEKEIENEFKIYQENEIC